MNNDTNINDNNAPITDAELENLSEDQLMDLFVEQMIIDKGLDEIQGEMRDDLRQQLKENLNLQINRSILAELPDDKFKELAKKMEAGELQSEEITKAVEEANLDLDKITEETMLKFRELYLNGGDRSED